MGQEITVRTTENMMTALFEIDWLLLLLTLFGCYHFYVDG